LYALFAGCEYEIYMTKSEHNISGYTCVFVQMVGPILTENCTYGCLLSDF
jgi:hypothetical protein